MVTGIDEVTVRGGLVVKRHGGDEAVRRATTSATAMRAAGAAGLPVPAVVALEGPVLRTSHLVHGVPGVVGLRHDPVAVLVAIGRLAARLHAVPPPDGIPVEDPDGVWVHGDLCPVNVLVDGGDVTGVVDWEDTRVGDPLVDLVWTEWLVRTHHPDAAHHVEALYAAYGLPSPPATDRRRAMRAVLVRRRDVEQQAGRWRAHLAELDRLDPRLPGDGPDAG